MKLIAAEQKLQQPSSHLVQLQNEMADLKIQHRMAIHQVSINIYVVVLLVPTRNFVIRLFENRSSVAPQKPKKKRDSWPKLTRKELQV